MTSFRSRCILLASFKSAMNSPTPTFAAFSRLLPALLILCGIALRLRQYLHVRSLWLDEAFLANSMLHESFAQILSGPLQYGHVLPQGFIAFSKLMSSAFDNHELALRFLPFLLGCATLPIVYQAARIWISRPAALLALALASFSEILIYYSNEFKSYSVDAFFAAALLAAAGIAFATPARSFRRALLPGLLGLLAPWFSQPSLFMLAPVAICGLLPPASRRNRLAWLAILCLWGLNVLALFGLQFGSLNPANSLPGKEWVLFFFAAENAFMPARTPDVFYWLRDSFIRAFTSPACLGIGSIPGMVLFVAGAFQFLLSRRIKPLLLFLLPFALCLLASRFHLYAFDTLHRLGSRGLLFLLPGLYLAIAAGADRLAFQPTSAAPRIDWTKALLLLWLLGYPLHQSLHYCRFPETIEDMKSVVADLQPHLLPTDTLYAYYWTEPALRHYGPRHGIDPSTFQLIAPSSTQPFLKDVSYARLQAGLQPVPPSATRHIWGSSEVFGECAPELKALLGRGRVWFLFTHIQPDQKKAYLDFLDRSGTPLRAIERPGTCAYLYQL